MLSRRRTIGVVILMRGGDQLNGSEVEAQETDVEAVESGNEPLAWRRCSFRLTTG